MLKAPETLVLNCVTNGDAYVSAYAVFHNTQTGPGGPSEPTGNTISADYVYDMQFEGDLISHMTKIWNDTISIQQFGWA
jgi:hypothetical protein